MKRNVLGKGIAAIISNEPATVNNQFQEIDIDKIHPNPHQPRKQFNPEKLHELAESMKESGIIQPVVVYRQDEDFYLIVGERRWRAAQLLKWQKIPAVVRDFVENEVMIDSLVENIQRENLNALEIANGIDSLQRISGLNHQQVGEKLGMSRTAVTNFIRLLKLPEYIKELIANGHLDQGHARALLGLEKDDEMVSVAKLIVQKDLTVRQAEQLVKCSGKRKVKNTSEIDPNLERIQNKLIKLFSTKVDLKYHSSGKGNLTIFFESLDDFQRILSLFSKEPL